MKIKKNALVALLCVVLFISLLPVSAFADQTVVIIGGALEKESAVITQGNLSAQTSAIVSGGSSSASVIVADKSSSNTVIGQSDTEPSSAVLVMPNGSVLKPQASQAAQTQTSQVTQQSTSQSVAVLPTGLAYDVYKRVNEVRMANGLGILGYDAQLQSAADIRAQESAVSFGHTRPDGSEAVTAVTVDYTVAGENLIQVTSSFAAADLLVETWMASETHKANILLADFTQTAIGIYEANGVTYVSQIFSD